jgi:hypothetical protein
MGFDMNDCIKHAVGTMFFCWVCMATDGGMTTALGLAACITAFGADMNPAANFQSFASGGFKDVEGFAMSTVYALAGAAAANQFAGTVGLSAGAAPSNDFDQGAFIREAVGTMFFLCAANGQDAVRTGFALMASAAVFHGTYNPAVTFSNIGVNGIQGNFQGFLIMFAAQCLGAFLANLSDSKVKQE